MSEKVVADILRDTKTLLVERQRWTKGTYASSDGHYCLVGGIEYAMSGGRHLQQSWRKAYDCLAHVIAEQYPDRMVGSADIETFNDHYVTELADIEVVLDKAILLAEEEV